MENCKFCVLFLVCKTLFLITHTYFATSFTLSSLSPSPTHIFKHTHTHTPQWDVFDIRIDRCTLFVCTEDSWLIALWVRKQFSPPRATAIPPYLPSISNRFTLTHTLKLTHRCSHTSLVCLRTHSGRNYAFTHSFLKVQTSTYALRFSQRHQNILMKSVGHTRRISIGSISINVVAAARNNRV